MHLQQQTTASNMLLRGETMKPRRIYRSLFSLMSVESYKGIPDDDYLACMTGYLHPGPEGLRLDLHNSSKV